MQNILNSIFSDFVGSIVHAIPLVLTGVLFSVCAYLIIRLVMAVVQGVIRRLYGEEEQLIVSLWTKITWIGLWFTAGLMLLNTLGMEDLAASLGTATGFLALGVAFALKDMIADFVAGVYLIQDPDFTEGDQVEVEGVTGVVTAVDLRKSRIQDEDGDIVVFANSTVEKKWTRTS